MFNFNVLIRNLSVIGLIIQFLQYNIFYLWGKELTLRV